MMEIIRPLYANGALIHRYELIKNLALNGHEVHVICTGNNSLNNVCVHDMVEQKPYFLFAISYIIKICSIFIQGNFDVVCCRNPYLGLLALLLTSFGNTKLVYEENGIISDELAMQYGNSKAKSIFKRINGIIVEPIDLFVAKRADIIRVVTPNIRDYLIANHIIPQKIHVICNGANIFLFRPTEDIGFAKSMRNNYNIQQFEKIILFVGNFAQWQGIEYLIEAAPFVIEIYPEVRFILVGGGQLKDSLVEMVEKMAISNYFIFTGPIYYKDVPKYINFSHICVAPFTKERNNKIGLSPLKIYEYAACGKPIVSSKIPNLEFIEENNLGILVEPNEPRELANAILSLLVDEKARNRMGSNGKDYVANNHSWTSISREYEKLCESSITRTGMTAGQKNNGLFQDQ